MNFFLTQSLPPHSTLAFPKSGECYGAEPCVTARGCVLRGEVTAWTAIIINVSGPCYGVTACRPKGGRRPELCRELCRLPLSTLIHNRNPVPSSRSPHAPASLFAVFPNLFEPFRTPNIFFSWVEKCKFFGPKRKTHENP